MDQEVRNRLRNVVTQSRRLLEDAISQELEGKYGIFARKETVTADPEAKMPHLSQEEQEARKDILDHYAHIQARGFKPKEALDQLVREVAFTHLNRLCAYKMMEAREVYVRGQKFRESVSRGVNSNGVKFYLAEHEEDERFFNSGQQDIAYRHYLDWLGGQLSEEIGVLFNPNDPANRLYPRQKTLDEVLDLLNNGGIKTEEADLREQWPQIWSQDETIGWVYQYFTPKELRDQARKESSAPRNSYELAFRNQFFTPRYVVEFLTDNTLGRIWYEMRKGDTKLRDQCRHMVRRPYEKFLKEGEQPPKDATEGKDDISQEELLKLPVHIQHRPKKDPRELKILDPACGSGHFLLYCFDLLLTIYEEAYTDPGLSSALKKDYATLDALKRDVPRLILAHNLHGVDIDLRASQIAALALWLRCQRAYQEMGLKKDRPQITRSNFVCAEPMPGEEQMLKEFVGQLEPKVLGQVVEVVFDKMKLAGEAGSLLKIEEEIRDAIREAKRQYAMGGISIQRTLFDKLNESGAKAFLVKDITDSHFFEGAEAQVIEALRSYAEKAQTGQRLQRRLFTEDAVRGFAFVDMCQKRYDVVLMNPPFGSGTNLFLEKLASSYPDGHQNLAAAFVEVHLPRLTNSGMIGQVADKVIYVKSAYESYRRNTVLFGSCVGPYVELGWNVLDANVDVVAAVLSKGTPTTSAQIYFTVSSSEQRDIVLASAVKNISKGNLEFPISFIRVPDTFLNMPNASIGFAGSTGVQALFSRLSKLDQHGAMALQGHNLSMETFARLWWEVSSHSIRNGDVIRMYKGGDYCQFYQPCYEVAIWHGNGSHLRNHSGTRWSNETYQGRAGIGYGKRGDWLDAHVMPAGQIFTVEGMAILLPSLDSVWGLLAYLNSSICSLFLSFYSGQHKEAGYLRALPTPEPVCLDDTEYVQKAKMIFELKQTIDSFNECSPIFISPFGNDIKFPISLENVGKYLVEKANEIDHLVRQSDEQTCRIVGVSLQELDAFPFLATKSRDVASIAFSVSDISSAMKHLADATISFAIGCAFGRWDIRLLVGKQITTCLPAPFHPLPTCPGGMLQGNDGLPLNYVPDDYPVAVNKDGLLIDDQENFDDISSKIRECLGVIWNKSADKAEQQLCRLLGVTELREYLRKPTKQGFWDNHVSRYSKGRRKAPIYWLLQSSKKNYAIWLYYHQLDKDLLFKALVNYVEPKIRLETSRLESFRTQKAATGDSGKEAKRLAKEVEKQEDFLSEMQDFEDKLRRAANLHLEPDLNDGVVLNIAPLWELVPWKEAKKYWDELLDGQYEWSSIGKQLRQKGLVK